MASTTHTARRRLAAPSIASLALALAAGSTACTLIIDRSAEQCESDADCADFPGTTCSEDNVCAQGTVSCAATQECVDKLGEYHVCRKSDLTCISLVTSACATVEGDYKNDAALLIGSVLPTQGAQSATGLASENAIKLAIHNFQQTSNGLPAAPGTSTGPRPLVLVGCNDGSDAEASAKAARHLVDVGVPAVIGASFSGLTIKMATEVTIPAGVLVISPSATSVAITDLQDNGLVWRTSPSDVFQADALSLYIPTIEQAVRQQLALQPDDKVKLAILHKGDAYGSGLGKALEKSLLLNGAPAIDISNQSSYARIDYGDPDNAAQNPPSYGAAVAQALAMAPHIVLIFGTAEGVAEVLQPLEEQWPPLAQVPYRARLVLSDGGVVNALWDYVADNADLRRRVAGTVPGTTNALFNGFRAEFKTEFKDGSSPDVFGAAGAYDATYLLAYSAVSLGSRPITGASLAEGLKQMIPPGPQVDAGTEAINSTFPLLASGNHIDFNGASGPLDFDPVTGEAPSDIQIWCLPADDLGHATSAVGSGLFYDAKSQSLSGSVQALCD